MNNSTSNTGGFIPGLAKAFLFGTNLDSVVETSKSKPYRLIQRNSEPPSDNLVTWTHGLVPLLTFDPAACDCPCWAAAILGPSASR